MTQSTPNDGSCFETTVPAPPAHSINSNMEWISVRIPGRNAPYLFAGKRDAAQWLQQVCKLETSIEEFNHDVSLDKFDTTVKAKMLIWDVKKFRDTWDDEHIPLSIWGWVMKMERQLGIPPTRLEPLASKQKQKRATKNWRELVAKNAKKNST